MQQTQLPILAASPAMSPMSLRVRRPMRMSATGHDAAYSAAGGGLGGRRFHAFTSAAAVVIRRTSA